MTAQTALPRPRTGRLRTPARPREQRAPLAYLARALAVPLVVTVPVAVWTAAAAHGSLRAPVVSGAAAGILVLVVAVAVAAQERWRARRLAGQLDAVRSETERFADELLPAAVRRVTAGETVDRVLSAVREPLTAPQRRILTLVADRVGTSESRRAAAMAVGANAAGRMQALATGMLADLRQMEHRHTDPAVLHDLLHLDHRTAQAGRLADSIAVLTGARSGRRWAKPIRMESILRGAMGRIAGYQRVRLHSTSEVAVVGHAAEGVMHALAELMDNAANFSPPTAEVHVYVEEVPAGTVVTVEDSGLVMGEVALRRAQSAVAADSGDLTGLSGTRLGLTVVGRLARKHGLTVSFRPSARGGTGAVMMIPQELLTVPRPGTAAGLEASPVLPPPAPAAAPTPPAAAERPDQDEEAVRTAPELGESGLPKRRRGQTLSAAGHDRPGHDRSAARPGPSTAAPGTPAERAARFSTFRSAVHGTAPAAAVPAPDHESPVSAPGADRDEHNATDPSPESDAR
ncbi:ATP-binding protein [Streptomyces sp. ME01-24h]|nr:ATP-binding protein [Streptomyces sp. ME19-03-3]MDX3355885.1 ATP-binding protein [Streptomyces sp. ME01-24h]